MSIILDCLQSTPEWFAARCGIATASNFDKICTPATAKASAQSEAYMYKLLAEWMTGAKAEEEPNEWMLRGIELEGQARETYQFVTDNEVVTAGFIYSNEERLIGCSPDGLIPVNDGDDGGLEIKCPAPHTHVEYLLGGKIPTKYIPQVQGCMLVTGRRWWDFMSFHPEMPPLIVRVDRDDTYICKLSELLSAFNSEMQEKRAKLALLQ